MMRSMRETRNDYVKKLAQINEDFCADSVEFRWQTEHLVTTNQPFEDSITKVGWMRSTECVEPNTYVFVMEFDSKGLNDTILDATKAVAIAMKQITGWMPVMKTSGSAGAHVYQKIKFPYRYTPDKCYQAMKDFAFSIYNKADLPAYNIDIGRLTKKDLEDIEGFIDMRMFERRRMLRGFSIHPKSKMYAVPFTLDDDLRTIAKRMRLSTDMPEVSFPVMQWMPHYAQDSYNVKEEFTRKNVNVQALTPELIRMAKNRKRGDRYYMCLTAQLKGIVNMDVDITHELKVDLVSALAFGFGMEANEIKEWLTANIKWTDFEPNSKITDYHINYIVDWVDEIIVEREYSGPDPEQPPIRSWALFEPDVD